MADRSISRRRAFRRAARLGNRRGNRERAEQPRHHVPYRVVHASARRRLRPHRLVKPLIASKIRAKPGLAAGGARSGRSRSGAARSRRGLARCRVAISRPHRSSVPVRKFSTSTSNSGSRRRNSARPSGVRTSSEMPLLAAIGDLPVQRQVVLHRRQAAQRVAAVRQFQLHHLRAHVAAQRGARTARPPQWPCRGCARRAAGRPGGSARGCRRGPLCGIAFGGVHVVANEKGKKHGETRVAPPDPPCKAWFRTAKPFRFIIDSPTRGNQHESTPAQPRHGPKHDFRPGQRRRAGPRQTSSPPARRAAWKCCVPSPRPGRSRATRISWSTRGCRRATVSRLTYTLCLLGFLSRVPGTQKYRLGSGVLALACPMLAALPIRWGWPAPTWRPSRGKPAAP